VHVRRNGVLRAIVPRTRTCSSGFCVDAHAAGTHFQAERVRSVLASACEALGHNSLGRLAFSVGIVAGHAARRQAEDEGQRESAKDCHARFVRIQGKRSHRISFLAVSCTSRT